MKYQTSLLVENLYSYRVQFEYESHGIYFLLCNPVAEVRSKMMEDFQFAADNISGDPNATASNITSWVAKSYLAELNMELGNNRKQ